MPHVVVSGSEISLTVEWIRARVEISMEVAGPAGGHDSKGPELFSRITKLWEEVERDWYKKSPQVEALFWHWSPDFAWHISNRLTGFNQAMIVYLLAMASPTHAVSPELYYTG